MSVSAPGVCEPGRIRDLIRSVPNFPRPGILFRDISPVLQDPSSLQSAIVGLTARAAPLQPELVIAAEARGFILGAALAAALGAGFVPVRKAGKLPCVSARAQYTLEYGQAILEVPADALRSGVRVLIHDDLLATGGTAAALCELAEGLGATVVGCQFLIELSGLSGRRTLAGRQVDALIELPAQAGSD